MSVVFASSAVNEKKARLAKDLTYMVLSRRIPLNFVVFGDFYDRD
jgi:hypothetical protein